MTMGEVLLRETVITMAPSVFQKTNFKGYLSQSQILNCLIRFLGSGMGPWAQILWEGFIFDAEHDDGKNFPIFEHFGKSRNKVWVPPRPILVVLRYQPKYDFPNFQSRIRLTFHGKWCKTLVGWILDNQNAFKIS